MKKVLADPAARTAVKVGICFTAGLLLSGTELAGEFQSFSLALVCALAGWPAAVTALGGAAGFLLFWGTSGAQGLAWLALGLPAALLLGKRRILDDCPLLMPALVSLILASTGLGFQLFLDDRTSVPTYLLRIALGTGCTKLFQVVIARRDRAADWVAAGIGVLALCRIAPFGLSLGYLAAGMLATAQAFPAAALGGLALDLAGLAHTPMTAVLCLAFFTRFLPVGERWLKFAAPGAVYLLVMGLTGNRQFLPFLGLALGGGLGIFLPQSPPLSHRRGETGNAQVRLELMAGCLSQTQQLLLEEAAVPIDEAALLDRAQARACGSCPNRKQCVQRLAPLPGELLHQVLSDTGSLPIPCRKPGRLILELHRAQEQYRILKADRQRQSEYRQAVIQQYQFLGNFLRQQSDLLPKRGDRLRQRFTPEVGVSTAGRERSNGDRCIWFPGPGCKYFVLLCDGMGTGLGAAREGQSAASLLRQMLCAGFPAEYALGSLNSMMVLRGRAGAVTVDLLEIRLDSGYATSYKWGAAPGWLLREDGAEKIGTAGPPPGLSVRDAREEVIRLSLRRGETLLLVSDGVDGEAGLRRIRGTWALPPGELAAKILEAGARRGEDDATVCAVRLFPGCSST